MLTSSAAVSHRSTILKTRRSHDQTVLLERSEELRTHPLALYHLPLRLISSQPNHGGAITPAQSPVAPAGQPRELLGGQRKS